MKSTRRALALYGELRNAIEFVGVIGAAAVSILVLMIWLDNEPIAVQIAGVALVFLVALLALAAANRFIYQPRWGTPPSAISGTPVTQIDPRSLTRKRAEDEPATRLEWVTCSECAHTFQVSAPSDAFSVSLSDVEMVDSMLDMHEYPVPCPNCATRWLVQSLRL